ncbi:hypothetical protein MKW98_003942 [Papaver atlanticum]|uniref:AB hydrolase-1 domain-containing protein n=1 Tax=Papaver atlanticum TaxID=357466 RepID=A0AAD4XHP3_9MAGN|nr:hypothetical protein MKW98_003942 [Papaver atlanticum]
MASVMDIIRLPQLIFFFYLSIIASIFRKLFPFFLPNKSCLSFTYLSDFALSLYFKFYCGLQSCTINLDDNQTILHFWIPKRHELKKPSLLLIHGFGGNTKWQYYPQAGSLHQEFNLYVPDLIFFGDSFTVKPDRTDVFQAECIGEGMKKLCVDNYSVFGISYGGYVAYRMADIFHEEIDKLMIMSSGICFKKDEMVEEVKKLGNKNVADILVPEKPEDLRVLINRAMFKPPFWVPDFFLKDFINVMYMNHRNEKMEMLQNLIHKESDSNSLPVLNQETMILWGDKDKVFPLYLAFQLERHLGEKSRVEIIKDAGHAANLESPHLVNHLIRSFLLD